MWGQEVKHVWGLEVKHVWGLEVKHVTRGQICVGGMNVKHGGLKVKYVEQDL